MTVLDSPYQRISKDAIRVWRLTNIIENTITIIVFAALIWSSFYFQWYLWISITLCILLVPIALYAIWEVGFKPAYLQISWRFSISEDFIHIHNGVWIKKKTIIPMSKVQFVELKQGPLFRRHDLFTISVQTIRSVHAIPAIKSSDAHRLRDEIAMFAKVDEED